MLLEPILLPACLIFCIVLKSPTGRLRANLKEMGEPFTVECRATLAEGGAWLIQARLRFSGGHLNADRELLAEARAALLRAIADAGMEGRARGATSIRIFMDAGDGRITEFEPQGMRDHLRPQ